MGGSVQRYGGVHGHEHHARVDVYLLDAAPPHLDCLVVSQAVVDTLVELKYLNDEEFAEWFVRQRQLFRPRSAYVVRSELHRKVRRNTDVTPCHWWRNFLNRGGGAAV